MFKPCKGANSENGVALIMVLGLLTVMVLMAVTFAITMRTERLAAGNYADTVRARELVQVGLARAMNDMVVFGQYGLGTNGLSSPGSKVYPDWPVMVPYTVAYTNTSKNVYLVYATNGSTRANEATNFVPRALWAAATNADYLSASNHWLLIESITYTNGGVAETNRMGRVKYLVLNCSGLLDANYAGGPAGTVVGVARVGSTSPADIAIGNLGEIKANFPARRMTSDIRYETLGELNTLAEINKPATNLFVYSRALPGYWNTNPPPYGSVGTQVNLSGTATNINDRRVQITDALMSIGISSPDAFIIWRNLMDYVDPDSIHTDSYASVESVPMINEVVVSNVVSAAGLNDNMDTYIFFELWYPFVKVNASAFEVQYKATFTDLGGAGFKPSNIGAWKSVAPTVTPGAQSFAVIIDHLPVVSKPSGSAVDFNSTIIARVVLVAGGEEVDQVEGITLNNKNVGVPSFSVVSSECLDPRFNWYLTQWQSPTPPTLGVINSCTLNYLNSPTNTGDISTEMYVANRPLQSVAELGYLVYSSNAPWHTVKLYGTNLHRVLDVFGLSTNTSDIFMTNTIVYRGLVNCNSNSALDATAVVFADMPVDQYPGEGLNPLLIPAAQTFASTIFSKGVFTNLSDIGYNLNSADFQFPAGINELQRESYFRNAFNLLNLRQNVFTIIIEAQAASGGNIPKNPAKQRAVAIVWRDPYTGEMFVRNIKWLGD